LLLHQASAHGYTLIEQLKGIGLENLHPRVVYRALREMEENEWVVSTWDADQTQGPPRRVYSITARGDVMLNMCIQTMQQTRLQIDNLMDAYRQHMLEGQSEHQWADR
jgi:DNA-binding PadR family transcriptional regulator